METNKQKERKTYCPPQIQRIEIDNEFSLLSPLLITSEVDHKMSNTTENFYKDQTKMNIEIVIELIESETATLT